MKMKRSKPDDSTQFSGRLTATEIGGGEFNEMSRKMAPKPAKQFVSAKLARTCIMLALLGAGFFYLASVFESCSWFSKDPELPTSIQAPKQAQNEWVRLGSPQSYKLSPGETRATKFWWTANHQYNVTPYSGSIIAFGAFDTLGQERSSADFPAIRPIYGERNEPGTEHLMLRNNSQQWVQVTVIESCSRRFCGKH